MSAVHRAFVLAFALVCQPAPAALGDAVDQVEVELDGDWLIARRGRDETLHEVKVRIWGRLRDADHFEHRFGQLDDDPEAEYVVISRNAGSGPYYKLQIVDFRADGISTWGYDSYGRPRVDAPLVHLGALERYRGAQAEPRYTAYRLTPVGLVPREVLPPPAGGGSATLGDRRDD